MITLQRVQDQALVSLGDLRVREPPLVGQVHLRRDSACLETRSLGVELEVHSFSRLDAHDELVPADILEDALGDVFELNTDLDLGFIQRYYSKRLVSTSLQETERILTLAGLEDERDSFPSRVVNPKRGSGVGWAVGVTRNRVIVKITRLAIRANVLAKQGVRTFNGRNGTQNLDLNIAYIR